MSVDDQDPPIVEATERALHRGGLVEPVVVHDRTGWHRVWRLTRLGLLAVLALAMIALGLIWIWRVDIADDYIRDELAHRNVTATYTLDRIGFRTQQVSNLTIGDPANPDLIARRATIQMRVKWNGSFEVYRVVARGVRLKGRQVGTRISWGQVDRLLPPPDPTQPFTLPDLTVDLKDTTVALATAAGPMGFAVEGLGNLSGGFKGKLAVAAHALRPGACTLEQFRAFVDIGVVARRPEVKGPIGAVNFACPASDLRLVQPRLEIDSSFSEAFGSYIGRGRVSLASAEAGENGIAGAVGNISFEGTPTRTIGGISFAARQARLARILAERTRFDGRYRLNSSQGVLGLFGDYRSTGVAMAPSMTAAVTDPLASAAGTPLGPIAAALSTSIRRAASQFDVEGSLRLINQPGGGAVRIERADVRSPTGARVQVGGGGDGVTYYWPSYRLRIDGNLATAGGGLPSARVLLRQPRSGAPMSGFADIAPYAAGGARLTLGTVRFAARPDGWTQVSTVALLDGPIPSGRVAGLRVPISGRFGTGGALRFGEGCVDTRFASLTAGSLRLGPTRLPLCPADGAIVRRAAGGELAVSAATRNVRLRGSMGESPFGLDAAQIRYADDRFTASATSVRMGQPDAPVVINAETLAGRLTGGPTGTFAGADAIIGRVPLRLSEADGTWQVRDGDVSVAGGLTLTDRAEPAKFYPLRSDDVRFTLADSEIRATGTLRHPPSGTRVTDVTIAHNLTTGAGDAVLDVPAITFGPGLQPEELTPLTEGVIALVQGALSGQGRIAWTGEGEVSSTGEFTTRDMDLAAAFGPITGMSGTIRFTDLLGMVTAPGQVMALESVNPGILVENGVIRYQLLPDQLVKIERGEWPFMGGRLILQETILNFGRPTAKRLTFEVVGLDARTFVDSLGFKELSASGTFDGVLPMIFDDEGGRIVGGRLDSREGGGTLAYNGVVNRANLGMIGGFAFDALRDLRYRSMIIRLDGYLDGEFATRLSIEGVGLGNTSTQQFLRSINRIPFNFNVTIKGPFRALIATAKSFTDPTKVIEPALPRPLDDVPGITWEVRRREEEKQQTQTPVDEQVTTQPTPTEQQ